METHSPLSPPYLLDRLLYECFSFSLSLSSSRGTFLLSFPREILCCLKASFSHFQQRFFFFHLRMPSVPNLLGE